MASPHSPPELPSLAALLLLHTLYALLFLVHVAFLQVAPKASVRKQELPNASSMC